MSFDSIHEFLQVSRTKLKLDSVVDNTHNFLIDPDKEAFYKKLGMTPDPEVIGQFIVFDKNAPIKESDDFDILKFLVKRNMSIASITPTGGEIPTTSIGSLVKVEGGMAKITLSHIFDEDTEIQMYKLRNAQHIPNTFVELIFGSINDLQTKIHKMSNVLAAQVWYQGRARYTDPRTNTAVDITYDVRPELFPAPLTGAESWDNYATATGIQDLIDHLTIFYNINGFYPKCIKMSKSTINHLMRQRTTAEYATSMGLINNVPAPGIPTRVNRDVLTKMIDKVDELVPIEQWDAQYEIEVEPGRTVKVRYLPDHTYCFVQPKALERIWGPTIESIKFRNGYGRRVSRVNRKPVPGVFLKSDEMLKSSPPQSRAFGAGRMIPFVNDGRMFGGRKVIG